MDPAAATGITSAGRARRCPGASGSTRSRPHNPVFVNRLDGHMGLANSAALRDGRNRSRDQGHRRRGRSCAIRVPGSRPASSRTRRWIRCGAAIPPYTDRPARRGAPPRARLRGVEGRHRVRARVRGSSPISAPTCGPRRAGTLTARAALYFPARGVAPGGRYDRQARPRRRLAVDRRREGLRGRLARLDHGALLRARTTTTPATSGVLSHARGLTPRVDRCRRLSGAPGRRARHRRAGQRPDARHL